MILKTLQTLVPEFPKLEPGDPSTRARRFQQWLLHITQALEPAGSHVTSWWSWVRASAEQAHRVMTTRPVDQRESIIPREAIPPQFVQVESWLRPRILACLPRTQREWVDLRAQQGLVDPSNVLLFYAYKFFAPGSPDERDSLIRRVLNPSVCAHPGSAQIEHIRWRADIRRLSALGCYPPDLMLSYRALESIFSNVFDRAEPQLNLRWNQLKNKLGLPHLITPQALSEVSRFADTELSALVILGGSSLNPGLPLTDNQKARQLQIKESDKKRAAAVKAPAPAPTPENTPTGAVAARLSSPLSNWAPPCHNWTRGECTRGVSCHFHHVGIPVDQKRCFICGSSQHVSGDCSCPGGGKDPKKDENWQDYRERRKQAEEAGKVGKGSTGKGPKGKGKGKGKGKTKSKDGGYTKPDAGKGKNLPEQAKACLDLARAAAVDAEASARFPKDGVALDSWANVWLKHVRDQPSSYFQDTLQLAYGDCLCHKETSKKGVPAVYVPWSPTSDNIDLFPEGFLWERGCEITRGDTLTVTSPKGRKIKVHMWGSMPYITKNELNQLIMDLPEHQEIGRTGRSALPPKAARVARVQTENLEHLRGHLPNEDLLRIRSKYRNLPDLYWQDDAEAFVTPERFERSDVKVVHHRKPSELAQLWELCSGSGALSARARETAVAHLPPIDMRYGWYTGRRTDQAIIVHSLLQVGVMCLFAAPNCALWGNMVHGMPPDRLAERRERDGPALRFLAMCCFLQFLMGRHFMIENSGASKIFQDSPLSALAQLGLHRTKLDQCMYGAELEGKRIKKNTTIVSDRPVPGLDTLCDHDHEHLQLRGGGPDGSRTASAARYPTPLCNAILKAVSHVNKNATSKDGGRRIPSFSFCEPDGFQEMNTRWSRSPSTSHHFEWWPEIMATRSCSRTW